MSYAQRRTALMREGSSGSPRDRSPAGRASASGLSKDSSPAGEWEGSEPGADFDFSRSSVTAKDRELLSRFQRKGGDPAGDDVETRPLSALQKTITMGKALQPSRGCQYETGLEGLSTAINPAGTVIAMGCRSTSVLLLEASTMKPMDTIDLSSTGAAAIASLSWRPEAEGTSSTQNVLLIAQEDKVVQVHTSTKTTLRTIKEKGNKINVLEYRRDGEVFATGGSDKTVRVYDERTGQVMSELTHGDDVRTTGHSNFIYGMAWKPEDPQVLVTGGWDRSVLVWDLRLNRSVRSVFGPYVCGDSVDVKGDQILTGAWRHAHPLQLWDFGTGSLLTNCPFWQPEPEACMLYAAKFGKGSLGKYIFAGGSGRRPSIKVFQQTGELVGSMAAPSAVHALDTTGLEGGRKMLSVCCVFGALAVDLPQL